MEYEEGFNANMNDGQEKMSCPYEDGSLEAFSWKEGWDDAEYDRYLAQEVGD